MTTEEFKHIFDEREKEWSKDNPHNGLLEKGEIPISLEQEKGFKDPNQPSDSINIYYFLIDPDLDNEWDEEQSHLFGAESLYDAVVMAYFNYGPFVRGLTRVVRKDSRDGTVQAMNFSETAPVNITLARFYPMLVQLHMGPKSWAEGEWGALDFRSDRYRDFQQKRIERYG